MNNIFILLAAGKGKRFGSKIPKQYTIYKDKMLFEHSLHKAIQSHLFKKIILVINKSHEKYLKNYKKKNIKIIYGGNERYKSSTIAIKFLKKYKPKNVFIHDAARPDFTLNLLKKLNKELKKKNNVVPYVKEENSVKLKKKNKFINLDRDKIYLTQTPQCFNFNFISKLIYNNKGGFTDESSLILDNNQKINFIKGEKLNSKITNNKNVNHEKIKYGIGFDVHRLVKNRKLYLGGILIKSKLGTLGHSDGDPILHSVTDSILGASGMNDIGQKFSDKKSKFKNIRSTILLKKVMEEIKLKNIFINNIDINVITEYPKIYKHKKKIIDSICKICKIKKNQINLKGKTAEKLGIIGKEKAIACEVITSIKFHDR